ncbi:hypothetical protein EC950183_2302, partial [Escherichia coli 95.0183]
PLLIWWTPLCLIRQILTRRFRLYAYEEVNRELSAKQETEEENDEEKPQPSCAMAE